MKKFVIFLAIILLITGCGKKKESDKIENNYSFDTYKIAIPYKESINNNYIENYLINNYDIDNVQNNLMNLSTKYFKIDDNYYQGGQYLTNDYIKEILYSVNPKESVEIDGINIIPKYISYIHEQDYLDKSGKLNGISLGIVVNRYQAYQNEFGATLYKEISLDESIKYVKLQLNTILKYMREKLSLKDTRIIIGLYVSASPNSTVPGSYKYLGITSDDNVSLSEVNYEYNYLDSNEVMNKNINVYNSFSNLKKSLDSYDVFISGMGLFYNNDITEASVTVNSNYLSRDKLMLLEQDINNILLNDFNVSTITNVYIKVNKEIVGMVIKNKNSSKIENLIID